MAIERFIWTLHAEDKRAKLLFDRPELERAIHSGHANCEINRGRADWRIHGLLIDGRRFVAVYDHPHGDDDTAVRIVSVWDL